MAICAQLLLSIKVTAYKFQITNEVKMRKVKLTALVRIQTVTLLDKSELAPLQCKPILSQSYTNCF